MVPVVGQQLGAARVRDGKVGGAVADAGAGPNPLGGSGKTVSYEYNADGSRATLTYRPAMR